MSDQIDPNAVPLAAGVELGVAILRRVAGNEVGAGFDGESLTTGAMRMLIARQVQDDLVRPNRI